MTALSFVRRFVLGGALLLMLVLASAYEARAAAGEATSVWRVSDGESTVYLGGTVHLLRPADFPLPQAFEQAYNDSEQIYFEIDFDDMADPAVLASFQRQLTYNDGRTLRTVLNDEAYRALEDYLARAGIPVAAVQNFTPGMLGINLAVVQIMELGFTPEGVDAYFNAKTNEDRKAKGALETVQEQIDMLAALGEGEESEYVLALLQDMEEDIAKLDDMVIAWRTGDVARLDALFGVETLETPIDHATHELIFSQRNLRWLPQIEAMFEDADTEYVLVGAGHMIGEDGLLELLRGQGYSIEQLVAGDDR